MSYVREMIVTYGPRHSIPDAPINLPGAKDVDSAESIVRAFMPDDGREHFGALILDARHTVMGWHLVSTGTIASSLVHPRELYRVAIAQRAAAVILAHCHPSGDAAPSVEDDALTRRMAAAGDLLGIPVLDHLIIGCGTSDRYSYRERAPSLVATKATLGTP